MATIEDLMTMLLKKEGPTFLLVSVAVLFFLQRFFVTRIL